jgi:hypothetical protein
VNLANAALEERIAKVIERIKKETGFALAEALPRPAETPLIFRLAAKPGAF